MSISNKAILVSLHIRQSAFRKQDKRATASIATEYATDKGVGNYSKKLLPGCKEFVRVTNINQNLRIWFHENTLSWLNDGTRILKSSCFESFSQAFRAKQDELNVALEEFYQAYPSAVENARSKLGQLFKEGEYPSISAMKASFSCELTFMPVPDVADFRVSLSESEKQDFLSKMHKAESFATKEAWERIYNVVSKAASQMKKTETRLHDTLLSNITEMCALLPKLNISDDPSLEFMRQEVESLISGMSMEHIRASDVTKITATQQLEAAMQKMSAFM